MWTTFYLVKASFLALTWSIFKVSVGFRRAWWAVTVYTFLTFWPVVLSEFWECGNPASLEACKSPSARFEIQKDPLYFRFAFHISTDCFILVLPVAQIWKLKLPLVKKISVAAVFAIIIIDIIIGIVRNVASSIEANGFTSHNAVTNINLVCSVLEPTIAVFVCSLPPYRALIFKLQFSRSNRLEMQHSPPNLGERPPQLGKSHRFLSGSIS